MLPLSKLALKKIFGAGIGFKPPPFVQSLKLSGDLVRYFG